MRWDQLVEFLCDMSWCTLKSNFEEARMATFYDRTGKPIAYTEDNETIYLFSGEPVAYLYGDAVYSFIGRQLGWCEDGWIRDLKGACVFFLENSKGGGPMRPIKKFTPVKAAKFTKPFKGARFVKQVKPIKLLSWSVLSGEQFFF